ncbi:MAG: anaerobic ribonucleoside-triphosphate reductase activating protein [Allomuricauda sp.]
MFYHDFQVVLQEVPGEISLCFSISGCPLRCHGCHSPFLWKEGNGHELTPEYFKTLLNQYAGFATCVVFMGGEWHPRTLTEYLQHAQDQGYKTCLYTGQEKISSHICDHLTFLKTGKWDPTRGGLESKRTNQVFLDLRTNTILNHLFISK